MKIPFSILSLTLVASFCLFTSCDGDEPAPTISSEIINDLPADPPTGYDDMGNPLGTTGKYTLFSFENGIIPDTEIATSKWDIGFRSTTIIVNSGASGPGSAGAQVVNALFDEYNEAPEAGYNVDGATKAIPTGSGNGWYNATPTQPTIITPIAGKVIVIKTAQGKFAKVQIISYYKGAPANPNGTEQARYYTFRYVHQADGTRSFK